MAEFVVDSAAGDDANPGTPEDPVRTIGQANRLAEASSDATGRIILRPGVYATPDEVLPILIRPGYDLEGSGRDTTEIRITGEVRQPDGTISIYWRGTGVMVGRDLRNLTVRAQPAPNPENTCHGVLGVHVLQGGSTIENVNIFAADLPEDPRPSPPVALPRGFFTALYIDASDAICRDCRISHSSQVLVSSTRNTLIERMRLESGNMDIRGDVTVRNSEFVQEWVWGSGIVSPHHAVSISGGSPTFGPDNYVDHGGRRSLIYCWGNSTPSILRNTLVPFQHSAGIHVRQGSVVRVIGNFLCDFVNIDLDAGAGSLFQDNFFHGYGAGPHLPTGRAVSERFRIEAPTDFGGGPAGSRGMNRFGPLSFRVPQNWTIPAGGTIHAENCLWPEGGPGRMFRAGTGTIVSTAGAATDDTNFLQGREMYRASWRPRNDGFGRP
ncbi:MAG: DUF1565 domain-containing protein [Pseudomonadota bacterium]